MTGKRAYDFVMANKEVISEIVLVDVEYDELKLIYSYPIEEVEEGMFQSGDGTWCKDDDDETILLYYVSFKNDLTRVRLTAVDINWMVQQKELEAERVKEQMNRDRPPRVPVKMSDLDNAKIEEINNLISDLAYQLSTGKKRLDYDLYISYGYDGFTITRNIKKAIRRLNQYKNSLIKDRDRRSI